MSDPKQTSVGKYKRIFTTLYVTKTNKSQYTESNSYSRKNIVWELLTGSLDMIFKK